MVCTVRSCPTQCVHGFVLVLSFVSKRVKVYGLWAGKPAGLLLRPLVFVCVKLKVLARA